MVFHIYIFTRGANITSVMLSISWGLETVDKQVEYYLIWTFRLLRQILQSLGRLFQEKNSRFLKLFHQLKLFPHFHDSSIYQESTVDFLWHISSLSQVKLCSHHWLVIFQNNSFLVSVITAGIFINWNSNCNWRVKLVKYLLCLLCKNDIYELIL